jgi:hypothetical protein
MEGRTRACEHFSVPWRINHLVFDVIAGIFPSGRLGRRLKEPYPMEARSQSRNSAGRCASLTLPELEQSKTTILDALTSAHSHRAYKHAIEKFIAWYCSEPRLGFNPVGCGAISLVSRGSLSVGRHHQSSSFRYPTSGRCCRAPFFETRRNSLPSVPREPRSHTSMRLLHHVETTGRQLDQELVAAFT